MLQNKYNWGKLTNFKDKVSDPHIVDYARKKKEKKKKSNAFTTLKSKVNK